MSGNGENQPHVSEPFLAGDPPTFSVMVSLRGTCQCCGRAVHPKALVCTSCAVRDPEGKAWLAAESGNGEAPMAADRGDYAPPQCNRLIGRPCEECPDADLQRRLGLPLGRPCSAALSGSCVEGPVGE